MTKKNLQVVAVEGQHKLRWLHWWNLSLLAREFLCFPLGEAKEIELGSWIVRAILWAQVKIISSLCAITKSQF